MTTQELQQLNLRVMVKLIVNKQVSRRAAAEESVLLRALTVVEHELYLSRILDLCRTGK